MRYLVRALCLVLLGAVLFVPVRAEDPIDEGKPAYTEAEAQAYIQQIAPLVEQVTCCPFTKLPPVKLVTRAEMVPILAADLRPQLQAQMPEQPPAQVEKLATNTAEEMACILLGKYGFASKTLYLLPGNLLPLMQLAKVKPAEQTDILRLIIAHELTHALQDQQVDLSAHIAAAAASPDRLMAYNAVMEGHAMLVQEKVGKLLKLEDVAQEFADKLVGGVPELEDPLLSMMAKVQQQVYTDIYLGGRDFMSWQAQHDNTAAVWRMLANPPATTAMIFHPERYAPGLPRGRDYAAVLQRLDDHLGAQPWRIVRNMELGEMALRSTYAGVPEKTRTALLGNIDHTQSLQCSTGKVVASVTLMTLRDGTQAGQMIDQLEAVARENIAKLRDSAMATVSDPTFDTLTDPRLPLARRLRYTVAAEGDAKRFLIARIANGNALVEIDTIDVPLSDDDLLGIAKLVFFRLQE